MVVIYVFLFEEALYSYCCLCILIVGLILIVSMCYLCIVVLFYVLFVLCRSVYCLCVNAYCTTATWLQPNCS